MECKTLKKNCFYLAHVSAVRVGFRSSVYEVHVVEGEEVVVTIEMKGETAIDVMVNIATQDSTASGEKMEH